jgi:hypothetical protein
MKNSKNRFSLSALVTGVGVLCTLLLSGRVAAQEQGRADAWRQQTQTRTMVRYSRSQSPTGSGFRGNGTAPATFAPVGPRGGLPGMTSRLSSRTIGSAYPRFARGGMHPIGHVPNFGLAARAAASENDGAHRSQSGDGLSPDRTLSSVGSHRSRFASNHTNWMTMRNTGRTGIGRDRHPTDSLSRPATSSQPH